VIRRILLHPVRSALVLVLLAVIGAGWWLWHRAGDSSPVSREAALRDYRASGPERARPRAGVPAPGVYTYAQSGSERGGAGPLSVGRSLPDRARYVVTMAPGGYAEELDMSQEHIEGLRVRVGKAGSREVSRRTDVSFAGIGRDDRRDLVPPPLRMPRALPVGARWSARYHAGPLPVSARAEVVRSEVVEVGGRRYATRVIRTDAVTGGVHPGTRVDVQWWSPALALPLRWDIDMTIRGIVRLDTHATLRLVSVTPEV
jgi:hypothetical protein